MATVTPPEATAPQSKSTPPLHSIIARQSAPGDVIVQVGPEKAKYCVRRAFLIHYSEYFKKALEGPWEEGKTGIISISEVEPHVFNMFVEWLYIQKIPGIVDDQWAVMAYGPEPIANEEDEQMLRLKLYVFADRFLVPSLKSILIQEITKYFQKELVSLANACDEISHAFENLPSTDPLLDFYADSQLFLFEMRWGEDTKSDREAVSILPREFLNRFMVALGRHSDPYGQLTRKHFQMDVCSYHLHKTELEKDLCDSKIKEDNSKVLIEREVL